MNGGTILVGLDGSTSSRNASAWAAAIAHRFDAEILAVHALSPWVGWELAVPPFDIEEYLADVRNETATTWAAPFREAKVPYRTEVVQLEPATGILQRADTVDPRMIVVGAHGRVRWAPQFVGGVTSKLLHRSQWPVAVVPILDEHDVPGTRDVVAGVDGSAASGRALRWASALAQRLACPLRILTALSVQTWTTRDPPLVATQSEATIQDTLEALERFVADTIGADESKRVRLDVMIGHPVTRLIESVDPGGLIVVGTSGRSALGELIVGSVARGCAARSPVPVVAVP